MTSLVKPLALFARSSLLDSVLLLRSAPIHTTVPATQTFRKWYQSLWTPRSTVHPPYEHVTQVGDPVLRRRAADVPAEAITSKEVKFLVSRMIRVLHKYKCVGLAAPQIGTALNVLVMEFSPKTLATFTAEVAKAKRMEVLPLTVSFI